MIFFVVEQIDILQVGDRIGICFQKRHLVQKQSGCQVTCDSKKGIVALYGGDQERERAKASMARYFRVKDFFPLVSKHFFNFFWFHGVPQTMNF